MKIDISTLIGEETGSTQDFSIDAKRPELEDLPKLKDLTASGTVSQLGDRYLVAGTVDSHLPLECARCLKRFDAPIETDFSEEFSRKPTEDQFPAGDKSLDLAPMLRTVILLAVPDRPLHDPKCQGLCPVCGKDLNEQPHRHRKPGPASPFDALKKLKK
jgi:DUF177 domain-containing protein